MLAALLATASLAAQSHTACERRDGDCPACPHALQRSNPVAEVFLSAEQDLVASARTADAEIRNGSGSGGKDIIRFDEPAVALHTSLFYFCCHSPLMLPRMAAALAAMRWTSFVIDYDSVGCNLDHDNATVYLHALPSNQTRLFAWAALVEATLRDAGIPVNHPRASLFHMTLARVTPAYPTDAAVRRLGSMRFGSHRLCEFTFAGTTIQAQDCKREVTVSR